MPWYVPVITTIIGGILGFSSSLFAGLYLSNSNRSVSLAAFRGALKAEIISIISLISTQLSNSGTELYIRSENIKKISKLCVVFTGNSTLIGLMEQHQAISIIDFYGRILSLAPQQMEDGGEYFNKSNLVACIDAGSKLLTTL